MSRASTSRAANGDGLREAEIARRDGRLADAERICRQVLATDPASAASLATLALIALQVGKAQQASELMSRAAAVAPNTALYRRNLCEIYRRLGRAADAVAAGHEAVRLAPGDGECHYNLGVALDSAGDLGSARDAFSRAVEIDPAHNRAWNNLGSTLSRLGDEAAALRAYLRATEIDPGHAEAQNNAAAILIERGELCEARERLRLAIQARPDFLEAHQNLSTLTTYAAHDAHYLFLEDQLVQRNTLDTEQRLRLLFAVGKARDDVGRHDLALIAFHEANRLKRAQTRYDEGTAERLTAALKAAFSDNIGTEVVGALDPTPIFIVGMPRSGTTLIEQVLCSHPDIHGAGELSDFHEVLKAHPKTGPMAEAADWVPGLSDSDYLDIGRRYLERLRRHHPSAARITDKMPGNFHYLGFIGRALPGARIIHSMRDPMDSCLSNYTRLFNRSMEFAYDLGELGRYYNRYIDLMQHWQRVLPPGRVLHLRYESMVADFPRHARALISHVGLDWDDACLRFHDNRRPVRTASVAQVRRPVYASSAGRSRAYGEGLEALRAIVASDYPHGF